MAAMSERHGLGGRLPLQDRERLDEAQRTLYGRLMQRRADARPFRNATDQGELIGPFNAVLHAPQIGAAFLAAHEAEEAHTPLNMQIREIVILAVGSAWKSDFEIYAHVALAKRAGLPDAAIAAILDGREPDLGTDERAAWKFGSELALTRRVSDDTYAAALRSFGQDGVIAMAFLVALYHATSVMLNAFDVPAPRDPN